MKIPPEERDAHIHTSKAAFASAGMCEARLSGRDTAPHKADLRRHLEAAMMALEGETVTPETGKETTDD